MRESNGGAERPDPNADWARAIAEMTTTAEPAAVDVAHADIDHADAGRGGGEVVSPDESAAASSFRADDRSPGTTAGTASRSRALIAAMLGVATIVIGSLGIWAAVAGHDARAAAADANAALVDESATRGVERAVSSAVNTVFSYNYADTARTKAAAQRLLTGPAIRQYNQLFALVQQQAPKEKLVVTTRVTSIGVELLTQGKARLLVFANEQDTMAGKSSYGGAMFAVTAVSQDGRWKIENIDTFTSSS